VANYRVSTNTKSSSKNTKETNKEQTKVKRQCLETSLHLHIALAAGAQLAERHWLEERLSMAKARMFLAGTRMMIILRRDGQQLAPL
jgi:hypothetical protein